MRDSEIRSAVEKELAWETRLNPVGISAEVLDGVVSFSGCVATYPQRREAERVAGRVPGVRAVVDHLEVRIPGAYERTDEEIAKAAACAIASNTELPAGSIRISVDKARVNLEGIVAYRFQRASADRSVRSLTGVRHINNHIVIRPHAHRKLVKSDIEAALLRRADLDAHEISVDIEGDNVTLGGSAKSWGQRAEAERAAWASPGVCQVVNNITVMPALGLAETA